MLQFYGTEAMLYWMIVDLTSAIRAAALTAILASFGTAWMTAMGKTRGMTDYDGPDDKWQPSDSQAAGKDFGREEG